MITIWKNEVPNPNKRKTYTLPLGSQALKFLKENKCVYSYVPDSTNEELISFELTVVGTGWDLDEFEDWSYLDSYYEDDFVWHILARDLV